MSTHSATLGAELWHLPWPDLLLILGLPAFWIVSFLIYCVRCALFGMERTPRIDRVVKTPWLPRIFMEFGYWMFRLPVRMFIALHITANMITVGSMFLTLVAAIGVGLGHFSFGGWMLLFAFTCDSWDGIVARATGTVSVGGQFFDSTIDRYNDLMTFLGFMYYYRNDRLPLALIATAMVGSTVMSYARAKGEAVGVDPNVGYMQRHERAVWLGMSTALAPILSAFIEPQAAHPIYHFPVVVLGMIAVVSNITAIWRIRFVMTRLEQRPALVPQTVKLPAPGILQRLRRLRVEPGSAEPRWS